MYNGHRRKEDFFKRGVDEDVGMLRFKHFQSRLIDTINRVLQDRRLISKSTIIYQI